MPSFKRQASDFAAEWRKLMAHFKWAEGFSLVVLFVPDAEGAAVRRRALEYYLTAKGKSLVPVNFNDPEELKLLANRLFDLDVPPDAGAVWVEAVIHETDERFNQWEAAWREGAARLNQYRNPLRRKFQLPLVFVAAPWTQPALRNMAPDLWSVRTLVANIEPEASVARDYSLSLQMIEPLGRSRVDENQPDPELALSEAARLRGRSDQKLNLAASLYRAGQGFIGRADWNSAIASLSEAASLYESLYKHDTSEPKSKELADALADSIFQLGKALMMQYDHAAARENFEKAREIYRQIGHVRGEANCIRRLGDTALERSDHETARRCYEQALPLYRQIGHVRGEANCIRRLGDTALERSDHETARQRYEQALPLYRQIGHVLGEANCIQRLGDIALIRSDHKTARRCYEQALPLYRQIGDVRGEANYILRLGDIALESSELETAWQRYEQALPLYRRIGHVLGEANCIRRLGDLALRDLDHETARQRYEQALSLYRHIGNVLGEANCIQRLGDLALQDSDHEAARRYFDQALPLYRQIGNVRGEANCIQSLGDIELKLADETGARKRFEEALELYEVFGDPYPVGQARRRLARLAEDEAERAAHVQAAREAWESIDRPDLVQELEEEFGTSG